MQSKKQQDVGIVIVAAGRGERAGQEGGPKQYRQIGGAPVISHTLRRFAAWHGTGTIICVIHPDDENLFAAALEASGVSHAVTSIHGGATRQASVLAGLIALKSAAPDARHVMIHDAVRPFFDDALLERCAAALIAGDQAVLPAVAVADTLKKGDSAGHVAGTVPRAGLFAAQTPQSFELDAILAAHRAAAETGRTDFTDDAGIAEWAGLAVRLVEGDAGNIKLTLKKDLDMADQRLAQPEPYAFPDVRTGNGYDVHQLVEGDGVTLCGVFISHDQALLGHSDADVALHALTDALLATCGAGDIGDHFPPSDPQWRGAPSRIFLQHAAKIVREKGGVILNADISLIAEAPKVGPYRETMRQALSDMLGIAIERCSVKATTNEKIGFIGRREGIAAIATASVLYQAGARS
ncbi:bifunctional 2-C-methyl-D-erythritol 4-phosphate cytidylyltransferase/2-C-methyl-D-erythritol 2,4-cyclodiphosphate synthase [Xaviernesmea oryzae]|uniref:Bifunctional enzyme IspD/IspF n=1 Tax=Xaviernesmea oryzae TaxID=464029 RepID=A0A1Q9AX83_9HYPH|nr:bifunctional 2-C-methyl-D-erythritol 4-phosphate cytidylyltransferase/2-C-methyl-D-erythritol 2,4-cyclodiphosphate synthase [Xaviernesmea oryzae]OLP60053.1 bifunctional 2-C-methyl-D-erythritol 4-phosphate cytidylyltransferase/2-C-methyl-D-erythritol 2,4-cyclodiphosphate synthase [Xaviernesmea oryzae]SEK38472.1 2-C-methyl-D-erythritol 2,4-cyclodiphosphate synthase [Xaviernesmea oryzae]